MPTPRDWLRAALRLHELYRCRAGHTAEKAFLAKAADLQRTTEHAGALVRHAATNVHAGMLAVRRQFCRVVQTTQQLVTDTYRQLRQPQRAIPSVRDLLADFWQLDVEFGGLHLDLRHKSLAVTTAAIELEDVYLGPFTIRLAWERLAQDGGSHCFALNADDPNPAAANPDVTHPHVRDGHLCAGDAEVPIRRALLQGRLADAFLLVRSVLTTYNPDSPHIALDGWHGTDCHECARSTDPEDLHCCEGCGHDFCSECCGWCQDCYDSYCSECLWRCDQCAATVCSGCLRRSTNSNRSCCRKCLATCAGCGAAVAACDLDTQVQTCPSCTPDEEEGSLGDDGPEPVADPPSTENNREPQTLPANAS